MTLTGAILAASTVISVAAIDVPADPSALEDQFRAVVTRSRIAPADAALARKSAATFIYSGMCKGVGLSQDFSAIQFVFGADPATVLGSATIEMVGIYARATFGRPNSGICAKALDDAQK